MNKLFISISDPEIFLKIDSYLGFILRITPLILFLLINFKYVYLRGETDAQGTLV